MSAQRGDRITVDYYEGVAFHVVRTFDAGGAPGDDWPGVVAVMIGDDREHVVAEGDYKLIPEDEHICSCGQIGCPHD